MLLATLQLIADATAASPAAGGSSIDASTVGVIIASVVVSLGAGAGGVAIGRRTHISNSPLDCREVKDMISREEHDKDIREMREILRASEAKAHQRMDDIAQSLNRLIGLVEGIRDTLTSRKPRP